VIKGQVYTLRRVSVPEIGRRLVELTEIGLIQLYQSDGETYLEIIKFDDYQKFRSDIPKKEEYPIPVTYLERPDTAWPAPLRAETGLGSLGDINKNKAKAKAKAKEGEKTPFDSFWEAYPKKVGKNDAKKAWDQVLNAGITIERIIQAFDGYMNVLKIGETKLKYVKYPASFLRGYKDWDDFIGVKCKPSL
jgi:hypothetical protein